MSLSRLKTGFCGGLRFEQLRGGKLMTMCIRDQHLRVQDTDVSRSTTFMNQ